MPPFAGAAAAAFPDPKKKASDVVSINVGGQLFQTTRQTLDAAGPHSLLSSLPSSSFLDRDPLLFAPLLSLLRTGRLPSSATDADDLAAEARFYGLESLLTSALSGPGFDPFALRRAFALPLPGRDAPTALAASAAGLHVAHGGRVTSFDASLRHRSTILTPLPAIDSLLPLPSSAPASFLAAGATDFPGLHVLDLGRRGAIVKTLGWAPHPSAAGSTVQSVAASHPLLFTSFESCRRNATAIVAFDLATLEPAVEIGRREIFGAELDSGIPATKLQWASRLNLLMAAGSHAGPSGLLGNIRLWDIRTGGAAFELTERMDCFADVAVSDELSALFKVGMQSGELFMADFRKLSADEPWICLGDGRKVLNGRKEGSGCRLESYGNHVFCTRGGDVEMWSEVEMGMRSLEDGLGGGKVMRKNFLGRAKDGGGSKIMQLGFGGNRMVITRKDEQCVEVWEPSTGK